MTAPRHWIGVIAADHVSTAMREGLCAFSHGLQAPVERLAVGDRFAYYAPRTGIGEGDVVQAFIATGTVTGDMAFEHAWAGTDFTAWVRRADYDPPARAPVKPLLDRLTFVTNPRYWGMAFRRSLFSIPAEDFAVITSAMKDARHD